MAAAARVARVCLASILVAAALLDSSAFDTTPTPTQRRPMDASPPTRSRDPDARQSAATTTSTTTATLHPDGTTSGSHDDTSTVSSPTQHGQPPEHIAAARHASPTLRRRLDPAAPPPFLTPQGLPQPFGDGSQAGVVGAPPPHGLAGVDLALLNATLHRVRHTNPFVTVPESAQGTAAAAMDTQPGPGSGPLSCAVVGNSGILAGRGLGPEVDRHDVVIRFNFAPVSGYEDDVGTRTGVRIFYNWETLHSTAALLNPDAHASESDLAGLWLLRMMPNGERFLASIADPDAGLASGFDAAQSVAAMSPSYYSYVASRWTTPRGGKLPAGVPPLEFYRSRNALAAADGHRPTTGLLGIVAALWLCDKGPVTLYGFNTQAANKRASDPSLARGTVRQQGVDSESPRRYYYFATDNEAPWVENKPNSSVADVVGRADHSHDFSFEQQLRWRLAAEGAVVDRTSELDTQYA